MYNSGWNHSLSLLWRLWNIDDGGYRGRMKSWYWNSDSGTVHAVFAAGNFVLKAARR